MIRRISSHGQAAIMYILIQSRKFGQKFWFSSAHLLKVSWRSAQQLHLELIRVLKGKRKAYGYSTNLVEMLIVLLNVLKSVFLNRANWAIIRLLCQFKNILPALSHFKANTKFCNILFDRLDYIPTELKNSLSFLAF